MEMDKGLMLILGVLFCAVVYALMSRGKPHWLSKGNSEMNPYTRARAVFSSIHAAFFDLLEQALDDRYRIFGNLHLTEVVDVKADLNRKQRQAALKRLPPSRLDFVICDRKNAEIIGVVMIDEQAAADDGARVQGESALDQFLAHVGIPVARLSGKRDYSVEDLRIEVSRALFLKWKDAVPSGGTNKGPESSPTDTRPYGNCPACGLPFVKRMARKGTYAGKFFLTCSNYPECKQIRLIKDKSARADKTAVARSNT